MIHLNFAKLESSAERGNAQAAAALEWIDGTLRDGFERLRDYPDAWPITLSGADPAERVAEALATWIKESDAAAFESACGARYSVSGMDSAAEGMERLRDQSEFILLAYPAPDSTPESLADEWAADLDSVARPDGFGFDLAESVVRAWAAANADYLKRELEQSALWQSGCNPSGLDCDDWDSPDATVTFRLYVRDESTYPESE